MHKFFYEFKNTIKKFKNETSGNVALTFAMLSIPIFGLIGASIDYSRTVNERAKIQESMDAAMLAGVRATQDKLADGQHRFRAMFAGRREALKYYVASLREKGMQPQTFFFPWITVRGNAVRGQGFAIGQLDTTFSSIMGFTKTRYRLRSNVNLGVPTFTDIHIMLDNSNSMGIGASLQDIQTMENGMGCAFACHTPSDLIDTQDIYGTLERARNLGVTLRIDVLKQAVKGLLDTLEDNRAGGQVRTAIYTASNTLVEKQGLTANFRQAKQRVDEINLENRWLSGGTSMDHVIGQLENTIGTSGNGQTRANSKKIVVIVTDGIQSNFRYDSNDPRMHSADPNFVNYEPNFGGDENGTQSIQGFNPRICRQLKELKGADVYTINLEYYTPDFGPNFDRKFVGIKLSLKDRIPQNMTECASSPDQYFSANTPDQIKQAFEDVTSDLFNKNIVLAR